jgi:cobalt-precorrin 5A hydrolase/precorrin-3B C17-methyltransferase
MNIMNFKSTTFNDIISFAFNDNTRTYAGLLPFKVLSANPRSFFKTNWLKVQAIIYFAPVPIAVRSITPYVTSKETDPAVLVVDINNKLVIPLIGTHKKSTKFFGANQLAKFVANKLNFTPVITTQTERLSQPTIQLLRGYRPEGDYKKLLSLALQGKPLEAALDDWDHLPIGINFSQYSQDILVTDRLKPDKIAKLYLRPPSLYIGLGLSSDCPEQELINLVKTTLLRNNFSPLSIASFATIDSRGNHVSVSALAQHFHAHVITFPADMLSKVKVPNPSEEVYKHILSRSVAEAAALLSTKLKGQLVVPKQKSAHATISIARVTKPIGKLSLVGIGPGSLEHLSFSAYNTIINSEIIIGYDNYIERIMTLIDCNQEVFSYPIGQEEKRATDAVALARAGYSVAVISSGDPQVFGMASLTLQAVKKDDIFEINIVPGITASLAAGALLGAPLGHDFAIISLSDLHTPTNKILKRLRKVAEADMVIALYNPTSSKRQATFKKAIMTLSKIKPPETVVGIVKNAFNDSQSVELTTLSKLLDNEIDMNTILLIGSSKTYIKDNHLMITPRYDS